MLIPLQIPPGMYKNGTPYQRRGRWVDGNLVRWYEGSIRAIGGWLRRQTAAGVDIPSLVADPNAEAVRDAFSWRSLNQDQNVVLGSNLKLYHLSQTGTVTDVTPGTVVTSSKDALTGSGYGLGPYGFGAYGVENDLGAFDPVPPNRWAFDNFGEVLLACQRGVGPMYELNVNTLAISNVANAPAMCQDVIVTDQRIVFTIGAEQEPRLVKWSGAADRTLWAANINNQAGDYTLQGSGKLLRCINVLKQVLILGESDAYVAQYLGPPYIYGFDLVGRNCGPICAEAVVGTEKFAMWWGNRQFWMFDGAVQQIPCDVMEFLMADLDPSQVSKITAVTNQRFSEIWWFYQSQSTTTTEVDSYVSYNYRDNTWWTGRLNRTAAIDSGTLRRPLMVSNTGVLYTHELRGVGVDGQAFIESGAMDINGGDRNMAVRYIYPDTETLGDIAMTIYGRQFPSDVEYIYGPYVYNNPTPTRAMGREVRFRFDSNSPSFEVGVMRADVAPAGVGRR